MIIKLLGKRILLNYVEKQIADSSSGLIIGREGDKETQIARVYKKGPEVTTVEEGQMVMFKLYAPDEVEFEGTKYMLIEEDDCVAILL